MNTILTIFLLLHFVLYVSSQSGDIPIEETQYSSHKLPNYNDLNNASIKKEKTLPPINTFGSDGYKRTSPNMVSATDGAFEYPYGYRRGSKRVIDNNKLTYQSIESMNGICEVDEEIRRLTDFGQIKRYVYKRSLEDRVDPSQYDVETLKNAIVTYHNIYRSKHGAPNLVVDPYLDYRGKYYSDLIANHKGCLIHEQPRVYGENLLFFGAHFLPNPITLAQVVVESFYLESQGYNYTSWYPYSYYKSGHFTQLVWKKSRRIGVGITIVTADTLDPNRYIPPDVDPAMCVKSSSSYIYLIFVCVKYDPPGNPDSEIEYLHNVEPPLMSF